MKSKTYELRKSTWGFDQNCTFLLSNHHGNAVVTLSKAEWPTLIKGKEVVAFLVGQHRGEYQQRPTEYNLSQHANGWVNEKILELEKTLDELKFLQKIARRRIIEVDITKVEQ